MTQPEAVRLKGDDCIMQTAVEMITPPQIKKIWYQVNQIGLSKEEIYEVIESLTGKNKMHSLTKVEGIIVIDTLLRYSPGGNVREGMASTRQLWKIEQYRLKLGWELAKLHNFIKKYAKVENPKWLTEVAASGIINGLKTIYLRQGKKSDESED